MERAWSVLAVLLLASVLMGCVFKAELDAKDANAPTTPDQNKGVPKIVGVKLAVVGTPSSELEAVLASDAAKALQVSYKVFAPGQVVEGTFDQFNEVLLLEETVTRGTTLELARALSLGKSVIIVKGAGYKDSDGTRAWNVLGEWWPVNTPNNSSEAAPKAISVESTVLRKNRESPLFAGFEGTELDFEFVEVNTHGPQAREEATLYDDEGVGFVAIASRSAGVPAARTLYFAYDPEITPVVLLNALDYLK